MKKLVIAAITAVVATVSLSSIAEAGWRHRHHWDGYNHGYNDDWSGYRHHNHYRHYYHYQDYEPCDY